jgi:LmbE family N-acetylglucosaminyl deacetylase
VKILDLRPRCVLAVYAHPDDADVAAGGALAAWAESGAQVHIVVACEGDKGAHSLGGNEKVLAKTRLGELEAAAEILGTVSARCLGFPDGEVSNTNQLQEMLVRLIRELKPDILVGPDPTATFFGGVYVNHRDHREIGWALLDAAAPASAMPLYFPHAGNAHQVGRMLLSGTHEPDVIIDISGCIDKKVAAVLAHKSQMGGDDEVIGEVVRGRAINAGKSAGISYGEQFRNIELSL